MELVLNSPYCRAGQFPIETVLNSEIRDRKIGEKGQNFQSAIDPTHYNMATLDKNQHMVVRLLHITVKARRKAMSASVMIACFCACLTP